jgi:hypothetical protein
MAIAEVASRRASGFGNLIDFLDVAYPGNVAAGDLLVCGGQCFCGGGASSSNTLAITDTRATSYSEISFFPNGSERLWIAYGIAPSSGANTVRVEPFLAGNYISFSIDEFSGVDATTPLSVDGGGSTGTSTAPADSITTATANELVIGCMGYDGATTTIAPGGSWTQIGEHEDNSSDEAHALLFGIVTTAQAYSVDWTLGASKLWQCMTASFKAAAVTAAQPTQMIIVT